MAKRNKPTTGQPKSKFMVRLPESYRDKLMRLTERTKRKLTTEVQIALDKHFGDEKIA